MDYRINQNFSTRKSTMSSATMAQVAAMTAAGLRLMLIQGLLSGRLLGIVSTCFYCTVCGVENATSNC